MALLFKTIKPLFYTGTNTASRWFSYAGLGIGVLLLLSSIQMFVNMKQLMRETNVRKGGYDYVPVMKLVTNENMAREKIFSQADIDELKTKPFIDDVAPLASNQFQVKLSGGSVVPLDTDFFLESIENSFIDTVPPGFKWEPGQPVIPVIVGSDFLEIFNVFGPGYGLPQVSEETAKEIPVQIQCAGGGKEEVFGGRIVAFSDRINSVLVPKTFLDWANMEFRGTSTAKAARVYIKTKDANNPALLSYLDSKQYRINKEKTKFGRVKQVLQGIFSGLGVFGLLVVIMALLLFSFYLQLIIARSKDNLQLLLTLGYSPAWLSSNVSRRFIPVYIGIVLAALVLSQLMQWAFHHFVMYDREELNTMLHWSVFTTAVVLVALSAFTNYRLIRNLLYRLYA